ncbi:tryptophan 2,3-dioxygenase [Streptomyces sp. JV186]|uniref:tryptophan 2,3-dioxygenase n=1 Tax=Streptomyces sp. JV186 TaxID=858639 RepID=UPI002E783878|nr:tryptophan 2,3-dioxygenase [Streptomyces sp. JV186]MEE1725691.1 tryptophan 2,3-dioxygenase [Streptomyces sp. JV186]
MFTAELASWAREPDPGRFPYDAVVREYHRVGKHFVPAELLQELTRVRDMLPAVHGPWPEIRALASFLDTALDKPDGRYDYPTYLALPVLELPSADDPVSTAPFARPRCDRLIAQLVADALDFELAALDGLSVRLPEMRPGEDLVVKRCKHGLRAVLPALGRMALDRGVTATGHIDRARQVRTLVRADMSVAERRAVQLSVLPVYVSHDEYLFLRVLQSFETTFVLLAMDLRAAIEALAGRRAEEAVHFIRGAEEALRESAPLFSMLATMQIGSFRTFREFTEGASAIQSRGYKLVEALCRTPDKERAESPAFHSVPEIHARLAGGPPNLDDAYREARESGALDAEAAAAVESAMTGFAQALQRWRGTHYRLAVRMLGEATGTGYTEGTPYLDSVRDIPVFHHAAPAADRTVRTR